MAVIVLVSRKPPRIILEPATFNPATPCDFYASVSGVIFCIFELEEVGSTELAGFVI